MNTKPAIQKSKRKEISLSEAHSAYPRLVALVRMAAKSGDVELRAISKKLLRDLGESA